MEGILWNITYVQKQKKINYEKREMARKKGIKATA